MNNTILKPPSSIQIENTKPSVFLAGSIEMGRAEDWQAYITERLSGFLIYNPRRDDWNPDWEQRIDNPPFKEQVQWELDALDKADAIIMYLSPGTYSPISLLELGLHATSGKLAVICPEGFWRKGNVDIVCERFHIIQLKNLDEAVDWLQKEFGQKN